MTLRHAAALALVGWYLMVPPLYKGGELDESAPLSQWTIIDSFDDAVSCSRERAIVHKAISEDATIHEVVKRRSLLSDCVSTDDPRLKGK